MDKLENWKLLSARLENIDGSEFDGINSTRIRDFSVVCYLNYIILLDRLDSVDDSVTGGDMFVFDVKYLEISFFVLSFYASSAVLAQNRMYVFGGRHTDIAKRILYNTIYYSNEAFPTTVDPRRIPTASPTAIPSTISSAAPTKIPSTNPSVLPSSSPTDVPTEGLLTTITAISVSVTSEHSTDYSTKGSLDTTSNLNSDITSTARDSDKSTSGYATTNSDNGGSNGNDDQQEQQGLSDSSIALIVMGGIIGIVCIAFVCLCCVGLGYKYVKYKQEKMNYDSQKELKHKAEIELLKNATQNNNDINGDNENRYNVASLKMAKVKSNSNIHIPNMNKQDKKAAMVNILEGEKNTHNINTVNLSNDSNDVAVDELFMEENGSKRTMGTQNGDNDDEFGDSPNGEKC